MIKLRLSFNFSLSKVILGVAGISATICVFQYFIKNSKLKCTLKNDFAHNKTDSKKDNKVSNLVPVKSTVLPKLSKNKSAKKDFKNSKSENGLDKFSNKSKGCFTPSKKIIGKTSDCKGEYNSNCKRPTSKSDLNWEGPISENESRKANINEKSSGQLIDESINALDMKVGVGGNASTSNDDLQTDEGNCEAVIKKSL